MKIKPEPAKARKDKDEDKSLKPGTHKQHREESLDKTIEESFPASDPPSSIPDPDEDAA